jgi:putative ABC transport system substrate-binding protein
VRTPHFRRHQGLIVLGLLFPLLGEVSAAIAVLYPDVPDPDRKVFTSILEGIETEVGSERLHLLALGDNTELRNVRQWLVSQSPDTVITLGRAGYDAYRQANLPWPVVVGALDSSPHTMPGFSSISLLVDPSLLFQTVKRVLPNVRRVHTAFRPERDLWIIEQARAIAPGYGIKLNAKAVSDLRGGANFYWKIIRQADAKTDALWLPMDSQVIDDEVVLPFVVRETWARRLPVFSTSLRHVAMGTVFALYPDTKALGRRLAQMALRLAENPKRHYGIEPLRDVAYALNLRLVAHLGLVIDHDTEQAFDLIFPRQ